MHARNVLNNRRLLPYSLSEEYRPRFNARYSESDPILDRLETLSFRINRALKE